MNEPEGFPSRRALPLLLATLSMLGPFSIDTYLPSFPEIAHSLGATPLEVQQSLTAYLIPFAIMSLWHGAISDAFGRRHVVLVGLIAFALASIGCALAPDIRALWGFRAVQGIASGVGIVVGRAIIRDLYAGAHAQRVMSQVSVLFTIAPAIAPVIGGWLHEAFGWRSVFVLLAIMSAALAVWCFASLPETLPPERRQSMHAGYLLRAYARTLGHPRFLAVAFAVSLNFAALFLYIAAAPVFLLTHLRVTETQFYWLFLPVTAGMMLGAAWSGKLAGRRSAMRTVALGYGLMVAGAAVNVALHLAWPASLPWSVLPLFVYAVGMAVAMPSLTLAGLDFFPEQKGLTASCQAFLLTGVNALTAALLVPFASTSPARLAVVSGALMLVGLILTKAFAATQREVSRH
jgi:DHA1 family bicyclomycin/chloramphenicol resistance-like MFS transporter